jgi:SEC-C motif-containing protein
VTNGAAAVTSASSVPGRLPPEDPQRHDAELVDPPASSTDGLGGVPTDGRVTIAGVAKVGRNEPCPCGSGRKAKRCCGIERGPSEENLARAFLAHAASEAAWELRHVGEGEFDRLLNGLPELPELDLSLHAELPKLLSPTIDRFMDAFADDDPDAAEEPFAELLGTIDTPAERARLARAVIALRAEDRLDRKVAAAALIDLACDSGELLGASLLQAVAVRAGAVRTPAGVLLAA